ncbi:MAG: hypothetical protein A2X36_08300 [Elusimicrobia bacterium GWA2_69_24]|nr:MAG: hypothetical protein A2X36_08300 [Elusimicrobia bacterium GWA2_69_24]HBL18622.1 hypothetical protein [Elusimicrobiota bacterium]
MPLLFRLSGARRFFAVCLGLALAAVAARPGAADDPSRPRAVDPGLAGRIQELTGRITGSLGLDAPRSTDGAPVIALSETGPTADARARKPLDCARCHRKLTQPEGQHPAVGMGCDSCHSGAHVRRPKDKWLSAEGAALCGQCHDAPDPKKSVRHPPAAGGQCVFCHDPHRSANPKLLKDRMPDQCFRCHSPKPFFDKAMHSPVASGLCASCHDPHASKNKKLLTAEVPELCWGCHDKASFTGKKFVHSPVESGECTTCHSPHASDGERLLPKDNVCLQCHDDPGQGQSKKKDHPDTEGARCFDCHNPHQSDSEHLL